MDYVVSLYHLKNIPEGKTLEGTSKPIHYNNFIFTDNILIVISYFSLMVGVISTLSFIRA
jgi:hypothetical protein